MFALPVAARLFSPQRGLDRLGQAPPFQSITPRLRVDAPDLNSPVAFHGDFSKRGI